MDRGLILMKKFFIVIFVFMISCEVYAEKQLAGVAQIETSSPRTIAISKLLLRHLNTSIDSTDLFDLINSELLKNELLKFDCIEKKCILRLAENAKISLIISAVLNDFGDYIILKLFAYGTDIPYHGKCIYNYVVRIDMDPKHSTREYSLIFEEHAGYFISKLLAKYQMPVYIKNIDGTLGPDVEVNLNGKFDLFRMKNIKKKKSILIYDKIGKIKIKNSKISKKIGTLDLKEKDFVLATFKKKSDFLLNYYHGRKKEIIFKRSSPIHSFYVFLFTGPGSSAMPILAPVFGYYKNSDWVGLTLWAFNLAPYLYLEIDGLVNWPDDLRKAKKNISRETLARFRFGWYFLAAGGMALFVDAFVYQFLRNSKRYIGVQPFMGNSLTAGYLALVSGGGGHFFQGQQIVGLYLFSCK